MEDKFVDELRAFLKERGMEYCGMSKDQYYFRDRGSYYDKHRDIFGSSECWWEDVDVDFELWFKSEYPMLDDDEIVTEEIMEWADIDADEWISFVGVRYTLLPDELKTEIEYAWEELSFYDVRDDSTKSEMLGLGEYLDERFNDTETLAYWTVYFEPDYFDPEMAHECGLLPFTYKGTELLALGGCGMDLSPKLDKYQALVSGTIDSGSQAFRQPDYFDYVAGTGASDRVKEKCKKSLQYILRIADIPEAEA